MPSLSLGWWYWITETLTLIHYAFSQTLKTGHPGGIFSSVQQNRVKKNSFLCISLHKEKKIILVSKSYTAVCETEAPSLLLRRILQQCSICFPNHKHRVFTVMIVKIAFDLDKKKSTSITLCNEKNYGEKYCFVVQNSLDVIRVIVPFTFQKLMCC